ncbi:hypothetical protein [Brachybacterium sp. UMB0905]|uniref:hypothetical protein n=1 Tax=Brachybacterium sp. UMB0905 TaxID=2069310 RepID=UPI0011AEC671|nr:hypothetical protein [Brachybacterium sp. UMB0905]
MDIIEAATRYQRGIEHAQNLLELHRRSGQGKRGRRRLEHSLNRAVVVTTVATWQATVQDLARTILDSTPPSPVDPNRQPHLMIAQEVRGRIGKFSTPNAENSRDLLRAAGFDPRPLWTWQTRPGRSDPGLWKPTDVESGIFDWLKVRHAIAHGDPELSAVNVLEVVRRPILANKDGRPALRLRDAQACVGFFHRLVVATGDGVADHLGVAAPAWESKSSD